MKFEKKVNENHQAELTVEADVELFNKSKGKAARLISKESKIPGFRPGKAPYEVIESTYGEEYIVERAIDLLLNDLYPEVLKEAEIDPYGPGKLDEIIEKDPPKFKLTIPLKPEVKLTNYKKVKFAYKLPKIGEKDVNEVIANLQTKYAMAEEVDRKSEKGDMITVKVNGVMTNPDEGQDAQVLKDTPHQVILGENDQEEKFPFKGFSKKLVGIAKDETKDFSYKYPEDSEYENLKGKEVKFSVKVDSIKKLIKPDLDDEFAKTLGVENVAKLKETIQSQLEHEKKYEYDNQYYNDLLDKLVEKSTVKYPPLALEDEIADVLKNFEQNLAGQNLDLDTYLKINTRKKEDFIEEDIKPAAKKRLEQALVMDEITRSEKIELDQNELQEEYAKSFMQMQAGPNYKKLQKQYTTQKLANLTVMQSASRLMNQKTLERIKAYATGEMDEAKKKAAESKSDDKPSEKEEKNSELKSEKKSEAKKDNKAKEESKNESAAKEEKE